MVAGDVRMRLPGSSIAPAYFPAAGCRRANSGKRNIQAVFDIFYFGAGLREKFRNCACWRFLQHANSKTFFSMKNGQHVRALVNAHQNEKRLERHGSESAWRSW